MARIMVPNDLDAHWMPFTANRQFKANPRLLVGAKGMYYTSHDGREVLDGCAGLWCVNAGHGRDRISEAVARQISEMDYSPSFQMGHPKAFELATRLVELAPAGIDHVFYCNSGSEAVDTALKMALAYHRIRGDASRTRLIGRERGYHGVGFGGISVGGIVSNRKHFGTMLGGVDHLRHTHDLDRNAFSWGQPEHGAELADDLERLVALHDASTIAAVIVEPIAGSTGVLIPPKGYLQRLREICDRHGILLIFDEVICGFGRTGRNFGADSFGVTPDMMTTAKGITNGAVPMGAVFAKKEIYDAFMTGPEHLIEFFHGYTYSGHPLACAAALATLDIYAEEKLFDRAAAMADYFGKAAHALRDLPNVIDIRNYGMVAAVELSSRAGEPTKRAYEVFVRAYEQGVLLRYTGDIIAISPPLIINEGEIDRLFEVLSEAIKTVA
ncbi:aspartate aminotransferase family protein [Tistrella bauzanensis]|uniref:Aspartate aminotransferase family protein n=1 Tax=Tistrella bauzanensis TaxID=657419 RepID=A0ABQ1I8Y3_9PROT|nr:aspartate aminotransferase family protein [Tistrella bauzanensis]GGB28551.1 aspartate aminotransferase family protein [Tistrella bauzanensis]